ncbi:MAG: sigma-70 family RNA polymerase sigma factor [Nitrospiraceae bacterium]|nr:sigma-70 family RNA polymerase sigma factor [Nitrospiraceae bacterium]
MKNVGRRDAEPDQEAASAVARAQSGDVAAFERLYRNHVGHVYALCLRMTADPLLAEELTQDAFVRAWQKLDSFRGDSAFGTWLHRLTVNVVLGERRARSRRTARVTTVDSLTLLASPAPGANPGTRVDLDAAIAQLPEGARTVFVLHDIKGYRHDEVAEMTGVAAGTSKAQLHRARKLLREILA